MNTNIYSDLETSGGQTSNQCLNVAHFFSPVLIRHLWQLETVVFLHWCLILALLLKKHCQSIYFKSKGSNVGVSYYKMIMTFYVMSCYLRYPH
jgi:hypothetical protein